MLRHVGHVSSESSMARWFYFQSSHPISQLHGWVSKQSCLRYRLRDDATAIGRLSALSPGHAAKVVCVKVLHSMSS